MKHRLLALALALALSSTSVALACGPFFPLDYLTTARAPLISPKASFLEEIGRIRLRPKNVPGGLGLPEAPPAEPVGDTLEIDLAELKAAAPGLSPEVIQAYTELRTAMLERYELQEEDEAEPGEVAAIPAVLDALPAEFRLYLEGASHYYAEDLAGARALWQRLLELPAAERKHRSSWAAWMLAKTSPTLAEGRPHYEAVCQLRAGGFADSLNLAAGAVGWLAKLEWEAEEPDLPRAIELYYAHYLLGGRLADNSIRTVIRSIADDDEASWQALARAPLARRIASAHYLAVLCDGLIDWPTFPGELDAGKPWCDALLATGEVHAEEAERLSWLAYSRGDFELAQRWLKLAGKGPVAQWIRAKLLIIDGEFAQAEALLAELPEIAGGKVVEARVPHRERARDPMAQVRCDLGSLQLESGNYAGALENFLAAGFWLDAAYLAERVLTPEELLAFTREHEPFRHVAARRFARLYWLDAAQKLMPEKYRKDFDTYIAAYRKGRDKENPDPVALWEAAQIHRRLGMELFGTEGYPDGASSRGNFHAWDFARARRNNDFIIPARPEELERAARHLPIPEKRYHYRYRAAKIARWAADGLPRNSELCAEVLNTAGLWLAHKDPRAANPFYEQLVRKCPNTTLGREAAKRNWLVK